MYICSMKQIEWRPLWFNDQYLISEYGDVKSLKKQKELKGSLNRVGYKYYFLQCESYPNGKWFYAHRLVLQTFVGSSTNLRENEVNHKDGNKLNNHYTNLEWVTHSYNIMYSYTELNRNTPVGPAHWMYGKTPSNITRKKQSEKKKGVLHPKFKGWYVYDNIRYTSSYEASKATGYSNKSILRWSSTNSNGWCFEPKVTSCLP